MIDIREFFQPTHEPASEPRIIVWFSCGAASAVAAKLALQFYGELAIPVYCDTSKSESPDNFRFRQAVEKWIGREIKVIRSEKYSTVDEVFEQTRYMSGLKGARCTTELKKLPRFTFQRADDIHIFGFTADEPDRISDFESRNPDMKLQWILRYYKITKQDCFRELQNAGIELPLRYRQGFLNNNCLCCVKATSIAYWIRERRINPVEFARRSAQSRDINCRLTRWKGKRIFLDEIPPDELIPKKFFKKSAQENVSCGPECGVAK